MTARTALPANPFPVPERALPPLARLDEYQIEQVLAQSSFAVVYRAHDTALNLQVAIKEYLPNALALRDTEMQVLPRSKAQAERFERGRKAFIDEAQLLARCDHPSLVHVTRILHQHGTVYRVMRHCPGPTLLAQRRDSAEAPTAATVRAWLDALLGALHTLHDGGCIHGAVAPGNIVLGPAGRPVLLDFEAVRAALISDLAQSMMVALEPCFAPIEQREPSAMMPLGPWTDLYSLAATLHFCISAHLPAPPAHHGAAAAFDKLGPLWQRRGVALDETTARLAAALDGCLLEWPQHRPQSVAAFQALLDGRGEQPPAAAVRARATTAHAATAVAKSSAPPAPVIATAAAAITTDERQGAQLIADLDQAFARIAAGAKDEGTPAPAATTLPDGASVVLDAPPSPSAAKSVRIEPELTATPAAQPTLRAPDRLWAPAPSPPGALGETLPSSGENADSVQEAPPPSFMTAPKPRSLRLAAVLAALAFVGVVFALADWGPAVPAAPAAGGGAAPTPDAATLSAPRGSDRPPLPGGATGAAAVSAAPARLASSARAAAAGPKAVPPSAPSASITPQAQAGAIAPLGLPASAAGPAPPPTAVNGAPSQPAQTAAEPPQKPAPPRPTKVAVVPKAKAPSGPTSPREVCGDRTQFSLYQCMQTQCAAAKWSAHAQCVRLRHSDSVD